MEASYLRDVQTGEVDDDAPVRVKTRDEKIWAERFLRARGHVMIAGRNDEGMPQVPPAPDLRREAALAADAAWEDAIVAGSRLRERFDRLWAEIDAAGRYGKEVAYSFEDTVTEAAWRRYRHVREQRDELAVDGAPPEFPHEDDIVGRVVRP